MLEKKRDKEKKREKKIKKKNRGKSDIFCASNMCDTYATHYPIKKFTLAFYLHYINGALILDMKLKQNKNI